MVNQHSTGKRLIACRPSLELAARIDASAVARGQTVNDWLIDAAELLLELLQTERLLLKQLDG